MRKLQFVNDEIYHIYNRGVDKRNIFLDDQDYFRFIHDLFEFNDEAPAPNSYYFYSKREDPQFSEVKPRKVNRGMRKLLVEILAFCLMPNHIHLLLRQVQEGGISKLMQKLGSYGLYYNKKYERKGHLFGGKFQAIHIKNEEQLKTVFVYIHTNPVAIIFPQWKEKGIKNAKEAREYIENYRWSSYPDYLENKNFPSLTNREFLLKIMGGVEGCRNFVNAWLGFKQELKDLNYVALE